MLNFIICGINAFVSICMYFSLRKSCEYHGGKLFLVSIPEWEMRDEKVVAIVTTFRKYFRYALGICLILSIVSLFIIRSFPLFMVPHVFILMAIINYPLRCAHKQLRLLKIQRHWPVGGELKQIDITIGAHMKQSMIRPIWFAVPICMAVFVFVTTAKHTPFHIMYLVLICIVPLVFYTLIKKMPNRTYCEDSTFNIQLNRNRRWMMSVLLMFLICADTIMFLAISLFSNDVSMWIVLVPIFIAVVCILVGALLFMHQSRQWRRIMDELESPIYREDEDDYWHYGWISGPVYNNPNDPEVFKDSEIFSNMTLNNGRLSVKIFYVMIFAGLGCLFAGLFGYPAYLDYQNRLVDVQIRDEVIIIDSTFYSKQIAIKDIQKVTLLNTLPSSVRTGGTDTGIYATGNYNMDGYGHVKMYVASNHKGFILVHTSEGIIVFNDDDTKHTKQLYKELQQMSKEVLQ